MANILVLDDELEIRNLCYEALSMDGHKVSLAANSQQFFQLLSTLTPDLLILDLVIPGEKDLSLLRRMPNQKNRKIPFVLFSGNITPELESKVYEVGAVDVIAKGIGIEEFCTRIQNVLNKIKKEKVVSGKQKSEKILVVDDDEGIRNFLRCFLEGLGYPVLLAENGEDAIKTIQDEKPAAVLLDMTLPGMDGIMILAKIREIDTKISVIMVSGLQDEIMAKEAIKLGAYAYVTKPIDTKYLELVILSCLVTNS